jgi:phenylalanyl-tRNA synthetase alpha chain
MPSYDIEGVKQSLLEQVASSDVPRDVLKAPEFKELYGVIATLPPEEKGPFGKRVNEIKMAVEAAIEARIEVLESAEVEPIDITAPWDVNGARPELLSTEQGTQHPLTKELEEVVNIFTRMGFEAIESRQIDDDYHMFGTLNFPEDHPARDGYDTFRTEEGYIPPAHTSTMQHRILKDGKAKLEAGGNIAAVSYGRVFRNEDVDATHEHTFYQCEGVFVSKTATLGEMLGTLRSFFETYYGQQLRIKTQPGYRQHLAASLVTGSRCSAAV